MALLTSPGPILRENMGSLTYIQVPLTTLNNSDTYLLGTNVQVVNCDIQGDSVTPGASNGADATYSATTGLVTICGPTQGPCTLVVFIRG
jgi:hypothetical protein